MESTTTSLQAVVAEPSTTATTAAVGELTIVAIATHEPAPGGAHVHARQPIRTHVCLAMIAAGNRGSPWHECQAAAMRSG